MTNKTDVNESGKDKRRKRNRLKNRSERKKETNEEINKMDVKMAARGKKNIEVENRREKEGKQKDR